MITRYLPLLAASLRRKRLRTFFTLASIAVAFLLYGLADSMRHALQSGVDVAGADRLITMHKVAFTQLVPQRYENRIRYMMRTTIPLTKSKRTYLALWDEVFINFGENVKGNVFDQNRAFIGIGQKLTDTTRLEIGFMEQTLQRRGGNIWENNHTASVWLTSKLPFGK